jgi:DNA-binding MarR family transcriptional regulator
MDRMTNLFGAAALRAVDLMAAATAEAAGRGAQAPAALAAIDREPGGTVERLRHHVGLSQPATVRLVDRLEADGLVARTPGRDGRSIGLELTPRGREAVAAVRAAREAALEELLAGLDARERATLGRLLERLLERADFPGHEDSHVCRLCDVGECRRRAGGCPVDRAAAGRAGPLSTSSG